jgi:ApaG protein
MNTGQTLQQYQITITPQARYIAEQSDAGAGRYAFAYTITITNTGSVAAQLISRHWIITDANNMEQEVRGHGGRGRHPLRRRDSRVRAFSAARAALTPAHVPAQQLHPSRPLL